MLVILPELTELMLVLLQRCQNGSVHRPHNTSRYQGTKTRHAYDTKVSLKMGSEVQLPLQSKLWSGTSFSSSFFICACDAVLN